MTLPRALTWFTYRLVLSSETYSGGVCFRAVGQVNLVADSLGRLVSAVLRAVQDGGRVVSRATLRTTLDRSRPRARVALAASWALANLRDVRSSRLLRASVPCWYRRVRRTSRVELGQRRVLA